MRAFTGRGKKSAECTRKHFWWARVYTYLKECMRALREESTAEDILAKTKACASANNLDLLPDSSRISKTLSRFRSTTAVEDVVSEKSESL